MYVMSRSKETHITAISSSFYQNVLLLTRMIPPPVEFQRHFKKGMFDKPNTAGFLHVSHYLSVIYDAKLFKQMVRWPILCKRDEATYRVEMKNFLCALLRDNPDLNFPSILMSHLIQAGGTKFQILMWKLSQLALRTYIKRELKGDLLNAPCTSPAQDLTMAFLNNVIAERCNVATETREETQEFLDAADDFLNDEVKILSAYKSEIFDRKENMKKLVLKLPADSVTQLQLMDTEDSKVTDLWKKSIFHKVQYVCRKNKELVELERCCKRLCKLISRVNSTSETFDINQFPGMRCNDHEAQSNIRHLICNADGSCPFSRLLWLLYLITMRIFCDIVYLSDLSKCLPFVWNNCEKLVSLRTLFNALHARIRSLCRDEQRFNFSQEIKNARTDFTGNNILIANRSILRQPPKLTLSLNQRTNDIHFYERLCPSLTEGKHKHLFSRYKREYHLLCELPAALSDFGNSWNSMSGWLSPRAHCVKCEQTSKGRPLSPLYSRLLRRSNLDLNHSRENVSHGSSASYEALNLTPRKRPSREGHLTTISNGTRARYLFSSTPIPPPSHVPSNTEN